MMITILKYDYTAVDHLAKLQRFIAASRVGRRFAWFAYTAIGGLAWLSAALFYVKQREHNRMYLASAAFAALLTAALPSLYRWYQDSFWHSVLTAETLRGVVGPTTLTLTDEGLKEAGPVLATRVAWSDVIGIERSRTRTFVVLAPLLAMVIPVAAFEDEAARARFEKRLD